MCSRKETKASFEVFSKTKLVTFFYSFEKCGLPRKMKQTFSNSEAVSCFKLRQYIKSD